MEFTSDLSSVTARLEQQTQADGLASDSDFAAALALVPTLSWSPAANVRILLLVLGDSSGQDDDVALSSSSQSLAALANLKIHFTFFDCNSVDNTRFDWDRHTLSQSSTLFSAQRRLAACANLLPVPFESIKQSHDVTDLYVLLMNISSQ